MDKRKPGKYTIQSHYAQHDSKQGKQNENNSQAVSAVC
jgi:hypothetical protein